MGIIFHEETQTFHLTNGEISYIMTVLPNGHLGNLYYGKAIRDREDFSHLLELVQRPMFQYVYDDDRLFSLESVKQELPVYGTTDYRAPMVEVLQSNGSRISDFVYVSHEVNAGKPKLEALPATYTENDDEAETLIVTLKDSLTGIKARMLYTIWSDRPVVAKSVEYINEGTEAVHLTTAYSMCLDLPDPDYQWMQLSGAWARERHIITRDLEQGVQSIGSNRGHSSHEHNPFIALKRETTDENQGEAIGISLVYSGNFKIQAEVDTRNTARILAGINPDTFDWKLEAGEHFQTPEAVIVYSDQGLNKMSQTFHKLYQKRLARGEWRDKPRPILINNWEATYFDFTREKLIAIAQKAKECGEALGDDFLVFRAELLKAQNQMSGWCNIFFCAQDIEISDKLIEKLNAYHYKNHLAHIYIYAYDNKPEIVAKAYRSEAFLIYFSKGVALAKEIGNEQLISIAYRKNIMIASTNGEYEVSLLYSIRTYEAMKDVDSVEGGRIYSGIAYNLCAMGENERAQSYYNKAIKILCKLRKPEDIAEVHYNMSLNCVMLGQYDKAQEYLTQCMKAIEKLHLNSLRVCNLSKLYGLFALVSILQGNRFNCERYLYSCRQFFPFIRCLIVKYLRTLRLC